MFAKFAELSEFGGDNFSGPPHTEYEHSRCVPPLLLLQLLLWLLDKASMADACHHCIRKLLLCFKALTPNSQKINPRPLNPQS